MFLQYLIENFENNGKSEQREHKYRFALGWASGPQTALWPSTMDSDPEENHTRLPSSARLPSVVMRFNRNVEKINNIA